MGRPKHKRTVTGFGAGDIKSVEASIPESQRDLYVGSSVIYRTRFADNALQVEEIREYTRGSSESRPLTGVSLPKASRRRRTLRLAYRLRHTHMVAETFAERDRSAHRNHFGAFFVQLR